ncbi:hypothetical protein FPOA_06932 [Fusarium poae]|uniref:Integral membrane protein n=1 Tax=Fusarium poae TaxID=36050 RepID=A0A1B8AJ41_FUSPO|nr:hypothetical protein FPOA_06932 [Fusarium poae]
MDQFQVADAYLLSLLSFFCILLFIYVKFDGAWSRNKCLVALTIVWIIAELLALIVFSLQMSGVIKVPWFATSSMYETLVTLSLWGIGTLQVLAVIFPIGTGTYLEALAIYVAALECIEVIIVVILIFIPQITVLSEIACIISPLTSQVMTMAVMYHASRGIGEHSTPKRTVIHHLWIGLAITVISMIVAVLSTNERYPRLVFIQGILYTTSSIMGFRPAERADRQPDIPLASIASPNSTSSLTPGICRPSSSYARNSSRSSLC